MKVACVLGSPRRWGNSAYLSEVFCKEVEAQGAEVETFVLNKLSFKGCQACMSCKAKTEKCVLQDDLASVLETVLDCNVLVLASPVYFGDVTAQTKAFIDRSFSFWAPEYNKKDTPGRLGPGKRMVFVLAQDQSDASMYADIFSRYEVFFRWFGFEEVIPVRACGVSEKTDARGREDLVCLAQEAAHHILGK